MATKSTSFVFLLVRCLPLLGRAILVSRLPCLMLPPFALPPSPRHHAACLLFLGTQLISGVGAGESPPQYHVYRVDPAASCGGILPRVRVCLGTGHWGGPVIDV